MSISKKNIQEYRRIAKKIGIWDSSYSSIKKDLDKIIQDIRNRDLIFDLTGAAFFQMMLAARLLLYGNFEHDLSDNDLKALFAPLEAVRNLDFVLAIYDDDDDDAVNNIVNNMLPLFFRVMEQCSSMSEFESVMRIVVSRASEVAKLAFIYSLALGVCMRKYTVTIDKLPELNTKLGKLIQRSKFHNNIKKVFAKYKAVNDLSHNALIFSMMLSTAIIENNLKTEKVDSDELYDFMIELHKLVNKDSDFRDYLHDSAFRNLMKSLEDYYDIDKKFSESRGDS